MGDERRLKFYVVLVNGNTALRRHILFEDTIAGALAYQTRKSAGDAAKKARLMYGWSKVVCCGVRA